MADKYFSDMTSLAAAAQKKLDRVLRRDVVPVVQDILLEHIKSDIYDVYRPRPNGWVNGTTYKRRYSLLQANNIQAIYDGKGGVTVTSVAKASPAVVPGYSFVNRQPGAFLKLLESGDMGIWHGGFARPAVSNAQREVDSGNRVMRALEDGLAKEFS